MQNGKNQFTELETGFRRGFCEVYYKKNQPNLFRNGNDIALNRYCNLK